MPCPKWVNNGNQAIKISKTWIHNNSDRDIKNKGPECSTM